MSNHDAVSVLPATSTTILQGLLAGPGLAIIEGKEMHITRRESNISTHQQQKFLV